MRTFKSDAELARTIGVPEEDIVTAAQGGRRLGLSYGSVYGRANRGQLPKYKTINGWRFFIPKGTPATSEDGTVNIISPPCGGEHVYREDEVKSVSSVVRRKNPRTWFLSVQDEAELTFNDEVIGDFDYSSMTRDDLIAEIAAADAHIEELEAQVLAYRNGGAPQGEIERLQGLLEIAEEKLQESKNQHKITYERLRRLQNSVDRKDPDHAAKMEISKLKKQISVSSARHKQAMKTAQDRRRADLEEIESLKARIDTLVKLHDDAIEEVVFVAKEAGSEIDYGPDVTLSDASSALADSVQALKSQIEGLERDRNLKAETLKAMTDRMEKAQDIIHRLDRLFQRAMDVMLKGAERLSGEPLPEFDRDELILDDAAGVLLDEIDRHLDKMANLQSVADMSRELIDDALTRAEEIGAQRDEMRENWVAANRENLSLKKRITELEREASRSIAGKAVSRVAGALLARGGKK